MTWLSESGATSSHPSPSTVPLARIGGVLRKGFGWSATCFPVQHGDKTLLVTPQHVLDGAGSSSLMAVASLNALDEGTEPIDLDTWRRSSSYDVAAVEVESELLRKWTLWTAASRTADIRQLDPAAGHEVHVSSLPRPLPGAVTQLVPASTPAETTASAMDWPGEMVLPHGCGEGASGSSVFMSNGDSRFGFAGIVTSAIVDSATRHPIGCAVLSSLRIEEFILNEYGPA